MIKKEFISIQILLGMAKYLEVTNLHEELIRNAMLLYPYILNKTISHGHAAEILDTRKLELIGLYDSLSFSYLNMAINDLDYELNTYRELKTKGKV